MKYENRETSLLSISFDHVVNYCDNGWKEKPVKSNYALQKVEASLGYTKILSNKQNIRGGD